MTCYIDLPVMKSLFCKPNQQQKARGKNGQNMQSISVLINH